MHLPSTASTSLGPEIALILTTPATHPHPLTRDRWQFPEAKPNLTQLQLQINFYVSNSNFNFQA